jgi:hypothetical protein
MAVSDASEKGLSLIQKEGKPKAKRATVEQTSVPAIFARNRGYNSCRCIRGEQDSESERERAYF